MKNFVLTVLNAAVTVNTLEGLSMCPSFPVRKKYLKVFSFSFYTIKVNLTSVNVATGLLGSNCEKLENWSNRPVDILVSETGHINLELY